MATGSTLHDEPEEPFADDRAFVEDNDVDELMPHAVELNDHPVLVAKDDLGRGGDTVFGRLAGLLRERLDRLGATVEGLVDPPDWGAGSVEREQEDALTPRLAATRSGGFTDADLGDSD